jgi:hypothetical protein
VSLTSGEFLLLLRTDETAPYCTYQAGDLFGMIAIYPFNQVFVLHWEEYRDGDRRNRQAYLRDEMHCFESADEVLAFVEQAGYPAEVFSP